MLPRTLVKLTNKAANPTMFKVAPRPNQSACLRWNLVSLSIAPLPLSWRLQAHPLCSWTSLPVRTMRPPRRDMTIFTAAGAVRSTVCRPEHCCPNIPAWCILMYTKSPEFSPCLGYLLLLMCCFHLRILYTLQRMGHFLTTYTPPLWADH